MAAIDRTACVGTGLGDEVRWRAEGEAFGPGWRDWFAPTRGLRPRPVEVLLAAVIAFIQVVGTVVYSYDEPASPWAFDIVAVILLTAGPVALLFRRRWPEATLLVSLVAAAAYAGSGYPSGPAGFPAFVLALVSAVMMGRRAVAWSVLLVAYPAFALLPSAIPDRVEGVRGVAGAATDLAWLPLVGAASEIARLRLERRAERSRAEWDDARRRVSEERLRIARELHDVLAHGISLISVRSGVALHLLDERPEQARPALEAINEASERALGELRSVLDVLHAGLGDDLAGDTPTWAPRTPTSDLRHLDGLVKRIRAAGLDVRAEIGGEPRPVPAEVDVAAFRVVQEALTNVVRHAGNDARTSVRLVYAAHELVVRVEDDGPMPGRPTLVGHGAGRGLPGMRERVHALGGTFEAGPRPGRGFRLRASFPLPGRTS